MWGFLLLLTFCSAFEIFIVPHSHCDPGWIETVKWYYDRQARNILNNIVSILQKDSRRKIVWSETSFLKMWMDEQSDEKINLFKSFVKNGQIEFVGGGYVQNDEANPDFEMVIRQLETGHQYLNKEFGITKVRVGWQIDPFGHSALTPSLWSKFGYEFLVTNRINVGLRDELRRDGNIEFLWEGVNFGHNESIFTHNLYDHYDPPQVLHPYKNHCFGYGPISDNILNRCLNIIYNLFNERKSAYKHDKLMLLYGDDFYYMNSDEGEKLYKRIEALRDYAEKSNEYPNMKIKIATASEYFDAVKNSKPKLSVYKGDLLPYVNFRAGWEPAHWTGYYTTRPHLKQTIYYTHKLVRATEIVLALSKGKSFFASESSLALHHDAITGTCRPQVVEDYTNRLIDEQKSARKAINDAIKNKFPKAEAKFALALPYRVLIVYNPLNWEATCLLHLEVSNDIFIQIKNWRGEYVLLQSVSNLLDDKKTVYMKLSLPALSFVTLFAIEKTEYSEYCDEKSEESETDRSIKDKHFSINFNDFGLVQEITKPSLNYNLKQEFWTYSGNRGGAYIFHPPSNGNEITDMSLDKILVSKGSILETVEVVWRRQRRSFDIDYYYQKIILYGQSRFIWKYGLYATNNEEILVRFSSNNINGEKWLLTSNSGDLRERKYYQESASKKGSNMYPAPGGFAVKLDDEYLQVFPKFSIGVAMVNEGSFELLLHRNLGQDDNFGLSTGVDDKKFVHYHFEIELNKLSQKSYWKSYLEAKTDIYTFTLSNLADFSISDKPWLEGELIEKDWKRETVYSLGFSSNDLYLSSLVAKNSQLVMRVLNLKDTSQKLSVNGFEFLNKKLFDGFLDADTVQSRWDKGDEFVFSQKPDSSYPKFAAKGDREENEGQDLLKPFELATFEVKVVPAKVEESIVEEKNEAIEEKTKEIQETVENEAERNEEQVAENEIKAETQETNEETTEKKDITEQEPREQEPIEQETTNPKEETKENEEEKPAIEQESSQADADPIVPIIENKGIAEAEQESDSEAVFIPQENQETPEEESKQEYSKSHDGEAETIEATENEEKQEEAKKEKIDRIPIKDIRNPSIDIVKNVYGTAPVIIENPESAQTGVTALQRLEYAVVICLSGISVMSIILYFRSKKKRKE
ncbi:MAN2A2_5 [Blepharisma stoltei]|uniref:Glycoside hydrolase family 38 central domain-containing protein n=1 Tax=Blepharisma stoltei TaxID=1481888 RepID=A0AAU9JIA9_9CILI|nr:unnamed protein product [Blepharisma stoltei]